MIFANVFRYYSRITLAELVVLINCETVQDVDGTKNANAFIHGLEAFRAVGILDVANTGPLINAEA